MGKAADGALDRGLTRLIGAAVPPMRRLVAHPLLLGTLMVLPVPLFVGLGTSLGLHWWRVPWPGGVSAGLLWLMAADAALASVLFGFLSLLFFLGLWRGRLGSIAGDKRPGMAYSYLVAAPQYGLIALWGRAALAGGDAHTLLEVGLILLLVSEVMRPWLKLLQRTEPGRGAA